MTAWKSSKCCKYGLFRCLFFLLGLCNEIDGLPDEFKRVCSEADWLYSDLKGLGDDFMGFYVFDGLHDEFKRVCSEVDWLCSDPERLDDDFRGCYVFDGLHDEFKRVCSEVDWLCSDPKGLGEVMILGALMYSMDCMMNFNGYIMNMRGHINKLYRVVQ